MPNGLAEPSSCTINEIRDVPYNKSQLQNKANLLELSLRIRTDDLVILGSIEKAPTQKHTTKPESPHLPSRYERIN